MQKYVRRLRNALLVFLPLLWVVDTLVVAVVPFVNHNPDEEHLAARGLDLWIYLPIVIPASILALVMGILQARVFWVILKDTEKVSR